jgi:hypothetical protein
MIMIIIKIIIIGSKIVCKKSGHAYMIKVSVLENKQIKERCFLAV